MKKLLLPFLLIFYLSGSAQSYFDLMKVDYGESFEKKFKNSKHNTTLKSFGAEFTFPVLLNDSQALITGLDFTAHHLQLFPEASFSTLYSSTLKLGLASEWNDQWSSTLVLLPKLASDYRHFSSGDFHIGLFGLLKLKKKENFSYKFGIYSSQEAYGIFATPILGLNYKSPNEKLIIDLNLPISGDINYKFEKFILGIDYVGISRSYKIYQENIRLYSDLTSIDFSAYLQLPILKNIWLKGKVGFATNQFEVYDINEKVNWKLSAFTFGDKRTQLNPAMNSNIYFKIEALYRIPLT